MVIGLPAELEGYLIEATLRSVLPAPVIVP